MAKTHERILTPGRDNWFQNVDFNEKYGIQPGDTVVLEGDYGDIDFKKIIGVTFVNRGQVTIRSITIYPGGGARDIQVLGNQDPAIKYGIRCISPNGRFAMNFQSVGLMTFRGISTDGNQVGFKIVHAQGITYPLSTVDLTIEDCMVSNCSLEAMYIGADHLTGPFISGGIRRNVVQNAGWDAIQCRVGEFIIEDNVCDQIGLKKAAGQDHGILIGGNTKSSIIRRNKLTNVSGYGIFNNGFGEQIIECNDLQCGGDGIMVQNYSAATDTQKVGYQKFHILNNTIKQGTSYAVRAYRNNTMPISVVYQGNKTSGQFQAQPGVVVTQGSNGPTVTPNCGVSGPVEYKNTEVSRTFVKNDCGTGYNGTTVVYTVPAGKYEADTQAAADNMAQADITANGQQYANVHGSCEKIPPAVVRTIDVYSDGSVVVKEV